MSTAETTTYRIPESNWSALLTRVERLARRAVKLGLTPPAVVQTGVEDVPLVRRTFGVTSYSVDTQAEEWSVSRGPLPADYTPTGHSRRYVLCVVQGEAPTLPGWELLAVVEHGDSEVGNVVRTVPGREADATGYRHRPGDCDHCRTIRRRLETFIIRATESGEVRQIGRNCLADFCRDASAAESMARAAEYLACVAGYCGEAEDDGPHGGRVARRTGTESTLALTARLIRHCGWVSRTKAREELDGRGATADLVRDVYYDPSFFKASNYDTLETVKLREAARDVTDEDKALAESALAWVRGLRGEAESLSDYLHNLLVVLTDETVQEKHLGIACSAISAYQREVRKHEETAVRAQANVNRKHVGTVGKRELFQVTVKGLSYFDGQYGVRTLVRMEDKAGNVLVWWTGETELKQGEQVILKGTVKSHDDYKGTPQTVLSRCGVEPTDSKAAKKYLASVA